VKSGLRRSKNIIQFWDDILRFIATIKLKETTASDIFRRLNSYSKQHGLYHALKAFGQIPKSIFILRVIDEPGLRMSIEKVLTGIEHVHAFTRAVSAGNPGEFLQAEKEDQEMAEACKRLIKNCIICWNYLYLPWVNFEAGAAWLAAEPRADTVRCSVQAQLSQTPARFVPKEPRASRVAR
jgi:TnpA family transposase